MVRIPAAVPITLFLLMSAVLPHGPNQDRGDDVPFQSNASAMHADAVPTVEFCSHNLTTPEQDQDMGDGILYRSNAYATYTDAAPAVEFCSDNPTSSGPDQDRGDDVLSWTNASSTYADAVPSVEFCSDNMITRTDSLSTSVLIVDSEFDQNVPNTDSSSSTDLSLLVDVKEVGPVGDNLNTSTSNFNLVSFLVSHVALPLLNHLAEVLIEALGEGSSPLVHVCICILQICLVLLAHFFKATYRRG